MILLHRLTPPAIALVAAAGFAGAIRWDMPLLLVPAWLVVALLFARLCGFSPRSFPFWYFVGTPGLFLLACDGFLLLLEGSGARLALSAVAVVPLLVFGELVFSYVHVPSTYPAYAIEHLSLALNALTAFFLSALMFGLSMLLQLPLWALSLAFALAMLFVGYGTLWASKVESGRAFVYALALSALSTELFAVATFLPTGYLTDAALVTVAAYVFLGLVRARFLDKLSGTVARRYAIAGIGLLCVVLGGARWA